MDIIDVVLAKTLASRGEISTYAAQARAAVTNANAAVAEATEAMENINLLTEETQSNNENSAQALLMANQALDNVNNALAQIDSAIISQAEDDLIRISDDEIDKILIELESTLNNNIINKNLTITYPSALKRTLDGVVKYYKTTGNNEDGTMTQKAITQAIRNAGGNGAGGISNLGQENAGKIVVVGEDGNITAGTIFESNINGTVTPITPITNNEGIIGIEIDYENRSFTRVRDAANLEKGADFNAYQMYGGRKRCLVDDSGRIVAFYGDQEYSDNPSNGYQVMVYQPKFYYSRIPSKIRQENYGTVIKKETILLSDVAQVGMKLHPAFINENNEELEYILLPAYDGSIQTNDSDSYTDNTIRTFTSQKLASVSNAKPISGENNPLDIVTSELIAKNRGTNWHIMNIKAESANQMLEIVEFGMLNGQLAIEDGICNMAFFESNGAAITGSTSSLGNNTGAAALTRYSINGVLSSETENGKRAISYRGMENPWGNIWHILGGISISGDGSSRGGYPYICKNFNYSMSDVDNYDRVNYTIPITNSWISAFGYDENFDWLFIPIECAANANSLLPIGDSVWAENRLNGINILVIGGSWYFGQNNGPFYYGCDKPITTYKNTYGVKLMNVPHLNDTYYLNNISLWQSKIGG